MLFSATMPAAIVGLARHHMRHPMNIRAESSYDTTMVPATAQFIYLAHDLDKPEIIGRVLQAEDAGKILVFTRTKRQAQRVADDLEERGFKTSALHGDMQQASRERALTKFREDKLQVLVATDVAARGIDVAGISHVINYTCPEDDKAYVHRIGRTGRAGASGIAITFVDWADLHRWKMINKTLDLPFDEPTETYSTSEHLFHDQGIPPGTKGRIVPPSPPKPREDREPRGGRSSQGDRKDRGGGGGGGDRTDRPRRNRNRNRTRSGETVAGASDAPAASSDKAEGESSPNRSRNRRRRRSSGSGSGGSGGSGSGEGQDHRHRLTPRASPSATAQAVTSTSVPMGANSHSATASLRSWRMQPCDCGVPSWAAVCTSSPSSIGMSWKPMATPLSPSVNRTKYCMVPESSIPVACSERE